MYHNDTLWRDDILRYHEVIGVCSICGGNVIIPMLWTSREPVKTCQACGAIEDVDKIDRVLPTIKMKPTDTLSKTS